MTRSFVVAAACLVAASVAGCAAVDVSSSNTLPSMGTSLGRPTAAVPLVDAEAPLPTTSISAAVDGWPASFEQYPTMLWLLGASGVLAEIGVRPVTILAPSENAFRDFAVADGYGLMSSPTALAPILRRHVLMGVYDADQLVAAGIVTNLAGEGLAVWRNGRVVMVDDVALTSPVVEGGLDPTVVVFGADRLLLVAAGRG